MVTNERGIDPVRMTFISPQKKFAELRDQNSTASAEPTFLGFGENLSYCYSLGIVVVTVAVVDVVVQNL